MPRPETTADKTALREKQFNELPIHVRRDIAQARNMRARMLVKRDEYLHESRQFKLMVRRLAKVHKLTQNKIALMLGLTWERVHTIIKETERR